MNKRAGRLEWWVWFFGASFIGSKVGGTLDGVILPRGVRLPDSALPQILLWGLGHAVILACVLWAQQAVTVRRARDRDDSVWPFWVYAAVVGGFTAVTILLAPTDLRIPIHPAWAWAPLVLAMGLMIFQFGVKPGDPRGNRWGPPPKPFISFNAPKPDNYRAPPP